MHYVMYVQIEESGWIKDGKGTEEGENITNTCFICLYYALCHAKHIAKNWTCRVELSVTYRSVWQVL